MPHLPRDPRRQILALLASLTMLDTLAGRTLLLADLPPALVDTIARSETKRTDLAAIRDACAAWPSTGTPHPLHLLLENAADLVPKTPAALAALHATLVLDTSPTSEAELAARLVELEGELRARDAIAALQAQLAVPGLPIGEVVLPGGRRLPGYLLVAHYTPVLRFVRARARLHGHAE